MRVSFGASSGVCFLLILRSTTLAQSVTASPSPVEQGQPITVTATGMDCKAPTISVGGTVVQFASGSTPNTWTVATTSLAPNKYSVLVKCGDVSQTTSAEVIAPKAAAPPAAQPNPPAGKAIQTPNKLYMPDGQLRSHKLRVFVTATIDRTQNPEFVLYRSHAQTTPDPGEQKPVPLVDAIPNSSWTETIDGHDYVRTGTVLLFDASGEPFGVRPMIRVTPTLHWTDGASHPSIIAEHDVNLGDISFIILWTAVTLGGALAIVIALAWRKGSNPVLLLTGVDGHLSLAQTQIALWTVVVAGVVFGYGILRLQLPDIPNSLLVLMGTSLITGGVAYFKDAQKDQTSTAAGVAAVQRSPRWGDLLRIFTPGQPAPELSLAKAQMLLWTAILLLLFVSKSILDGVIWDIPWQLVAFMGFSQAGYLAPKLASAT